MEFSSLFMRVLELSPFVGALLYFLFTVWNSLQKTLEAMHQSNKDNQAVQLQMQKENLMAQNNSADANRLLASAITDMKESINDRFDEIKPARNGSVRKMPVSQATPPQASA